MNAPASIELVAAQLPDPGHPSVVAFAAAIGGFTGGLVARVRRQPPEGVARSTNLGVWWGGGCGLVIWATTCVTTFVL